LVLKSPQALLAQCCVGGPAVFVGKAQAQRTISGCQKSRLVPVGLMAGTLGQGFHPDALRPAALGESGAAKREQRMKMW
jgi:hypothetical protein